MKIPIFNSLFSEDEKKIIKTNKIDIDKLNSLNLKNVDNKKFKLINLLKNLPNKTSLFETILVSANDELVKLFLERKLHFYEIQKKLIRFINKSEFEKYKKIQPQNVREILELNKYVRLKITTKSI